MHTCVKMPYMQEFCYFTIFKLCFNTVLVEYRQYYIITTTVANLKIMEIASQKCQALEVWLLKIKMFGITLAKH